MGFLNLTWNLTWFGETCVELAKFRPWKRLLKTHILFALQEHMSIDTSKINTDYRKSWIILTDRQSFPTRRDLELCQLKYCIDVLVPNNLTKATFCGFTNLGYCWQSCGFWSSSTCQKIWVCMYLNPNYVQSVWCLHWIPLKCTQARSLHK